MNDKPLYYCSFCGKSQEETAQLIAGPKVFICDECVELCMRIVLEHRTEKRPRIELTVETDFKRAQRDIDRDIDRWIERLQSLKTLYRS